MPEWQVVPLHSNSRLATRSRQKFKKGRAHIASRAVRQHQTNAIWIVWPVPKAGAIFVECYRHSMNPYASCLGDRIATEVIAETPSLLHDFVKVLGPAGLQLRSAPGKWTVSQILAHLADTEIAFAFRLRQALAEDHHLIQPFDQDKWSLSYDSYDAKASIETFLALRRWNLALIAGTNSDAFLKPLTHPERGQMTFQVLVETMAGHDLNHLRQIEKIASARIS